MSVREPTAVAKAVVAIVVGALPSLLFVLLAVLMFRYGSALTAIAGGACCLVCIAAQLRLVLRLVLVRFDALGVRYWEGGLRRIAWQRIVSAKSYGNGQAIELQLDNGNCVQLSLAAFGTPWEIAEQVAEVVRASRDPM